MIKISDEKSHEVTSDGLKVFVEGRSYIALTSPDAQRLVYKFAKEKGFFDYGLNKFLEGLEPSGDPNFPVRGSWLLKSSQFNTKLVRL